jgi:RimJ/RimL family protein N-acetyltransferase
MTNIELNLISKDDFNDIYLLTNNDEMIKNIADGKKWNKFKVERFIKYNENVPTSYKITMDNKLIGLVYIKKSDKYITIMIHPEYQSKGIGSKVLNIFIEKLKNINIKYFFVKIKQSNIKSIKLFQKFNLIKIGTEHIYNIYILIIDRVQIKEKELEINNNTLEQDFIYFKDVVNLDDIKYLFNELKNYSIQKISKEELKTPNNILKYEDEYLILKKNYYLEYYLNKITDYFSEECRVKCKFLHYDSPINIYNTIKNKNKSEIMNFMKNNYNYINNFTIYEYLYSKNVKMCSNFDITLAYSIYKIFKPKNMLDFSAGWGDRLIAAIAYDCNYTGVDPSECMENKYNNIIKTLGDKNKHKVIKSPFEKFDFIFTLNEKFDFIFTLNEKFDFIFTSPPFFKLEIYEETETQSSHYNDVKIWENEFLFPAINKCYEYLEDNKYLVLYITDYKDYKYVENLKKYIDDNKLFKYSGNIYFYNEINEKLRTIYVWKKVNNKTYIIDPMEDYDVNKLIDNLKNRGWREFNKNTDNNPTLLYVNTLDKTKQDYYYKLKPEIEYSTVGHRKITFKNNLFNTLYDLKNTNINDFNKIKDFLPIQHNINLYEYYKNKSYLDKYIKLFINNKIWIIKPVSGFKGKDIYVFENKNDFINFCNKIVNIYTSKWIKYKDLFNSERLGDKAKLNNEWVLQEYITNPFLIPLNNIVKENNKFNIINKPITKETKFYKFHFRGNIMSFVKNGEIKHYLYKKFGAYLAKKPYPQGKDKQYKEDDIHNTHYAGNKYHNIHLFFKDSFKEIIPKEQIDIIYNNMITLISVILSTVKLSCYTAKSCFNFFGIDILLTDDYKIKLLEFNANMSLTNVGDILMDGLTYIYIDNKTDDNFIEIKTNTAKQNYTYLLDSFLINDEESIKIFEDIFNKRGFRRFDKNIDKNPTLLFVETIDKEKRQYYYNLNPYIEFKVKGDDNIKYKNNLFITLNNLKTTNNNLFKKIEKNLSIQYNIDLYEYYKNKSYLDKYINLFNKNKVWIFKPVSGWKGKDVHVFDNKNDFIKYCQEIVKERKNIWEKNKHLFSNQQLSTKMKLNNEWVLQEYIKGLYIPLDNIEKKGDYNIIMNKKITKDKKLHKFHLRVNLLYFVKNNVKYGYFVKKMMSYIGKKPITDSNYSDNEAHNTHFQEDMVHLVFPNSYVNIIDNTTENNIENIYEQIKNIVKALLYVLNTTCYKAEHCFHIFGIDIIITPDYTVKLIEVNDNAGMDLKFFTARQLINGLANIYIDDILDINGGYKEDDNLYKIVV